MPRQYRHADVFSLEQLPEIVRLGVDVRMVVAAPERAAACSALKDAAFGTGWRSRVPRKGLRKDPRTAKNASGDSSLGLITPSLHFLSRARSTSARHSEKLRLIQFRLICLFYFLMSAAMQAFPKNALCTLVIRATLPPAAPTTASHTLTEHCYGWIERR